MTDYEKGYRAAKLNLPKRAPKGVNASEWLAGYTAGVASVAAKVA